MERVTHVGLWAASAHDGEQELWDMAMEKFDFAPIRESELRGRLGDKNLERAKSYALYGALFDARRLGPVLKARCESSGEESYWVRADFGREGLLRTECSCPVGEDGGCKHVGALLLTWCRRPEEFVDTRSVEAVLEERSREELLGVLREVLSRRPELETMFESLVLPANDQSAEAMASVLQRVGEVFRQNYCEELGAETISRELSEMVREARELWASGAALEAAVRMEDLCAAVIGRFRKVRDERGLLLATVDQAVEVMAAALTTLGEDLGARRTVLRGALRLYRFDIEQGVALAGTGAGKRVVLALAAKSRAGERALMSQWVRDVMERSEAWARRGWAALLMDLDSEGLDDAAWMALWQSTRQPGALVRRLIARGRGAEAVLECGRVGDPELASLLPVFDSAGMSSLVDDLVTARAERSAHPKLVEWLKARAALRDDVMAALGVAETVFHARPTREGVEVLKKQCEEAGVWEVFKPRVLEFLDARAPLLSAEVALMEGDLARAITLGLGDRLRGAGASALRAKIAEAAEQRSLPETLELYRAHAMALIALRGRANYREACRVALKVSELMGSDREGFETWLKTLREAHTTLTALGEELDVVFAQRAA